MASCTAAKAHDCAGCVGRAAARSAVDAVPPTTGCSTRSTFDQFASLLPARRPGMATANSWDTFVPRKSVGSEAVLAAMRIMTIPVSSQALGNWAHQRLTTASNVLTLCTDTSDSYGLRS
jgi:hypothetical protein